MILDLEQPDASTQFEADTVIVGGGAVGLSMLADSVRRGERVFLIEAGGMAVEDRSQDIVRSATSSGHAHEGVHTGRFRLLGGTTHFWGGQVARFDSNVFEARACVDGQHWPFGRDLLDRYYDEAMSLLDMDARIGSDEAVCRRGGVALPDTGPGVDYFFTRWLREPVLSELFKREIRSDQAQVLLHANMVGFARRPDGRHDLCVRTIGGRAATISARTIVLACGTMEIARLLRLPYVDGGAPAWADNAWIGRGYYDHIDLRAGDVTITDKAGFDALFENLFLDGYKYNPKLKLSEAAQRNENLLQACGAFIFSTSYKEHAANLRHFMRSLRRGKMPEDWRALPAHFLALSRIAMPMALRYLRSSRAFHPKGSSVHLRITSEQIPVPESAITLGESRDALDMPVLDVGWQIAGREIETIARCAEEIKAYVERAGLATVALDPRIAARDASILEGADDTNHQMGGARIGADRSSGVVDADLRVFGTDDIYVAGAAVMPTSGFVNCTLTAIALGLRLNNHLRTAR